MGAVVLVKIIGSCVSDAIVAAHCEDCRHFLYRAKLTIRTMIMMAIMFIGEVKIQCPKVSRFRVHWHLQLL